MKFSDMVGISIGNLWRMKLRTTLTIAGVLIAITAFVSMLSFGAGMQENISRQFNQLGLFNTMVVYPKRADESDTTKIRPLTNEVIKELSAIPGVELVYPYDDYAIKVMLFDTTLNTQAQALPLSALSTKLYSQIEEGKPLSSDTAKEAMVTENFIRELGYDTLETPPEVIGQTIIIEAEASVIDSGLMALIRSDDFNIRDRIREISFDSLFEPDYAQRVLRKETDAAINRFIDGYMNAKMTVADTLTIVGVLGGGHGRRIRTKDIIVTAGTANIFDAVGAGTDPLDMFGMIQGGGQINLFGAATPNKNFSRITLDIDPNVMHKPVGDSIRALGFRPFSYAEEFDEIKEAFIYFNMALAVVGLIALLTASLGIINTMVMSIIERRREIGVMKSLGADEYYIKGLFLMESALIGFFGAVGGIFFGWLISRIVSMIAKQIMENEGIDPMELFFIPWWLILSSLAIGIIVSILAGYFPSARASKIDAVEALRND